MTEKQIARSVLMSAALLLGVVGCPPEPPDDPDAGTGGSAPTGGTASGGVATGGRATGGTASVPVCTTVASLPAIGTACSTLGESQCDPYGNQCVCARGFWYCTTNCASKYPTEPAPNSACSRGEVCAYPLGVNCACLSDSTWLCLKPGGCPADVPATGEACDGFAGLLCDYPDGRPHMSCYCMANSDGSGWTWGCASSAECPPTQPPYSLETTCPGFALCSYGSTLCDCGQSGFPWICGPGAILSRFAF